MSPSDCWCLKIWIKEDLQVVKQIIREIADNFHRQLNLYERMAELSSAQLHCLEKQPVMSGELQDIMSQRQSLMEEISSLNEINRACQQQAVTHLNIDDFVLGKLRGSIEAHDYEQLKNVVGSLGLILEKINEMDRQNQLLMMEVNPSPGSEIKASNKQASQAYRQAMQHKSN